MKYHLTPVRMPISESLQTINVAESIENRKPYYTVDGNVNWYSHYGEQFGDTLEIYTQNFHMTPQSHSWAYIWTKLYLRDTCTRMFIAAIFTIARTWKKPKCPSTDDWIRKKWYIYTMEYYSAIKRTKIMLFAATWMELETFTLSEVRRRKTNTI